MLEHSNAISRLAGFIGSVALLAGLFASVAWRAEAQDEPLLARPSAQVDSDSVSRRQVNRSLMIVGATLFVGSYAPSLAFATVSDWQTDRALAVPVAGPWMALANPDNQPLSTALLINSGIMQGAGVLSMAMSLLIPNYEVATTVRLGDNRLRLAPAQVAQGGYGIGAVGTF